MHINPDGTKQLAFSPRWIFDNQVRLGIVCTKENGQRGRMTTVVAQTQPLGSVQKHPPSNLATTHYKQA